MPGHVSQYCLGVGNIELPLVTIHRGYLEPAGQAAAEEGLDPDVLDLGPGQPGEVLGLDCPGDKFKPGVAQRQHTSAISAGHIRPGPGRQFDFLI